MCVGKKIILSHRSSCCWRKQKGENTMLKFSRCFFRTTPQTLLRFATYLCCCFVQKKRFEPGRKNEHAFLSSKDPSPPPCKRLQALLNPRKKGFLQLSRCPPKQSDATWLALYAFLRSRLISGGVGTRRGEASREERRKVEKIYIWNWLTWEILTLSDYLARRIAIITYCIH